MKKAVFSIVASNYIPMANVLGDSIKKQHSDISYYIIIADKYDSATNNKHRYPVINAEDLGIDKFQEMAFKYNVTEFCTALKPYGFDYLFRKGYNKVIYFDPDIYVYSRLDNIFEKLDLASLVVTPHICTMQNHYSGLVPEGMLMHVGIFNFGFCAIANTENGKQIVEWWKIRLTDQCYADKIDGLHTDQKWMDFMPSLIDDLHIEKGLGYNLAIWNWHERKIENINNQLWVVNRINGSGLMPLVFFHYSNFLFSEAADFNIFKPKYIRNFPDLFPASDYYAEQLAKESMKQHTQMSMYGYATFDNGVAISHFHRRIYRRLVDCNYKFLNPFETSGPDTFYKLLEDSKLLEKNTKTSVGKLNEENFKDFDRNLSYIQSIAKFIKWLIGINRYALLCKFAQRFVRPENQTFLIREVKGKIPFYNENRYINWEVSSDNIEKFSLPKEEIKD